MNRCVYMASLLLALGLAGCATNKEFEKEILGQPAPESPNDTGWARQSPPPPPPPPAYAPAPYAPAPYAPAALAPPQDPGPVPGQPAARPPATPPAAAVQGQGGTGRPIAPPLVEPVPTVTDPRFAPKPFTAGQAEGQEAAPGQTLPPAVAGSPAQGATPAAAAASRPAPASSEPMGAPSDRATFTFLVGSYAHSEKAGELMTTLEARGFSTRMDQGKLNNKTFFKVYAVKEGNRAELEGELFAAGVTEPRLTEERPLDRAAPGKGTGAGSAKVAPAGGAKAPSPKPSGNIAPPIVEPAPPLPDGYVPPPPRAGGS